MSTERTTQSGSFEAGGETHGFEAIISCKVVPGDGPEDPAGYLVTFLPAGTKEYTLAWVDHQTFCKLQEHNQAYLAQLNRAADAEG